MPIIGILDKERAATWQSRHHWEWRGMGRAALSLLRETPVGGYAEDERYRPRLEDSGEKRGRADLAERQECGMRCFEANV